MIEVSVQRQDFDLGAEVARLTAGRGDVGAVVTFTGHVRNGTPERPLTSMTLEHYPAMTERQLNAIAAQAWARWPLLAGRMIHRFGRLVPGDQIVLVAVASAHRQAAFEAAEFLMDWLKTQAPFWKLEEGPQSRQWVAARCEDTTAADRWQQSDK